MQTSDQRSRDAPATTTAAAEEDLQASSAVLVAALERATALELRKQHLAPDDVDRLPLAREIESITLEVVSRGRYQTRLVELQQAVADRPRAPRSPGVVLEEWREAESRLHEARAELERATDTADRLRDEHRRAVARERSSEAR